ncbi:MAG: sulfotransferase [Proteobacteria bacterium]|nr:sulfotransferase [Pseudomonadota bacterium]
MIYRFIKKMDTKKKLGKRIIDSLIPDEKRIKLDKYLKDRPRTRMIRQVSDAGTSHLEDILQICLQHISPVTAPLALVSQISYSGGSLLGRLLDGHSKLHAYPHAFAVDSPNKGFWPAIDIKGKPQEWLNIISKAIGAAGIQEGLKQGQENNARFPFMYLPVLQKQIFIKYLESVGPLNTRHVFNAHMTACFGAWLNYQNHGLEKKFVTAYAPGLTMQDEAINNFFEIYPDGGLISIIRDPEHWFVSASRLEPQSYGDAESALSRWQASVRAAIQIRKKFGERVCLIKFEDLVTQTESVMRCLSEFLAIPYEDILLKPTFNGIAIQPMNGKNTGNDDARDNNFIESKKLDDDKRKLIKEMADADYQTALREVAVL